MKISVHIIWMCKQSDFKYQKKKMKYEKNCPKNFPMTENNNSKFSHYFSDTFLYVFFVTTPMFEVIIKVAHFETFYN